MEGFTLLETVVAVKPFWTFTDIVDEKLEL
jgi:hypothetical protein